MDVNQNFSDKAKRDYLLVTLAQKGDQKAYVELLEYYRDSIFYMLLKMVRIETDAEDLTIEAFTKAFKNLDYYTPTYAFSTWLFKIASNNAIDFLRRKKAEEKTISIDKEITINHQKIPNPLTIASDSPDPEEKLINSQEEKYIHSLIQKLHPNYKNIIQLRYYDELSYNEIADQLDIPLGTVKARLFRSRELLLGILKKNESNFIG